MFRRSQRVVYEEPPVETAAPVATPAATAVPTAASVAPAPVRRQTTAVAPAVVNPGAGFGLGTIGLLTLLLGAWAGIVPFVGPVFGYSATGSAAWVWNLTNALVWLVPGAVAVFFGFVMLSRAPGARWGAARLGSMWSGFIVACCGAWLAIGPFAWRVLEGFQPIRTASSMHELIYWVGYAIGPGIILALLGGAAMGVSMLTRKSSPAGAMTSTVTDERLAA